MRIFSSGKDAAPRPRRKKLRGPGAITGSRGECELASDRAFGHQEQDQQTTIRLQ
jgi:hypothetical protein